jgi:hypothetical protein
MRVSIIAFSLIDFGLCSYLQTVGSIGRPRQLNTVRFYCPLDTLAACQASGVVLTADALKPCPATGSSTGRPVVAPGDSLPLTWFDVKDSSVSSSSVTVSIAPFALDPPTNSFTCIGSCLTYASSGGTRGNVDIPANTANGIYTLLWLWKYGNFWYSSCADIEVKKPSSVVVATPTVVTNNYASSGCSSLPATFCSSQYGARSYCKSWSKDNCGRSSCHGGDLTYVSDCRILVKAPVAVAVTTVAPSTTTPKPINPTTTTTQAIALKSPTTQTAYQMNGCAKLSLPFCATTFGPASYCKSWSLDECGRALCHGDAQVVRLNNPDC